MIVIFLGPPGAGKGTQCKVLAERYDLKHLSSGDTLRRERKNDTELGQKAQGYMDSGRLVPDELIVAMMMKEMAQDERGRVILDGFPRTLNQACELDIALAETGRKVDLVLNLQVDDDKLEVRVTGRRSCPRCGSAYHTTFNPPRQENRCDVDAAELTQRDDDTAEVVRQRIKTYHKQTAPLVSYYQEQGNIEHIDGNVGIDQVTESLCAVCDFALFPDSRSAGIERQGL